MSTAGTAHGGGTTGGFGRDLLDLIERAARRLDALTTSLIGPKSDDDLGLVVRSGLAATTLGLVLQLVAALLEIPGGWGIEDFQGWIDIDGDAPGQALQYRWSTAGVRWLADLYVALDTLLFVPAYAVFLLVAGHAIAKQLSSDSVASEHDLADPTTMRWWAAALTVPIIALVSADLAENTFTLIRLRPSSYFLLLTLLVPALLLLWNVQLLRTTLRRIRLLEVTLGLVLALSICALAGGLGDHCKAPSTLEWAFPDSLGCAFHRGKRYLIAITALTLGAALALWLFAIVGDPSSAARQRRAELRSAIWDILLRSRYVLATLVLLAGLVLGLDQAQDVMYAVASAPWPDLQAPSQWFGWLGSALVYALAALSVWALGFACWLWTRSVCLIVAAGRPIRPTPGPADKFARHWARLLGLIPYAVVFRLALGVVADSSKASYAAIAQAKSTGAYQGIILSITGFAIVTLLLGLTYVRVRVRKTDTLYYNSISWKDWASDAEFVGGQPNAAAIHKYRLLGTVTPYGLPFVALLGVFAGRAIDLFPGSDVVPSMAFPIILFTLTVWLCFFGWLSILEVVRSIPWVLLLLALVGLFGLIGLSDNQRVWSPIAPGHGLIEPWARYRMLGFGAALAALSLGSYAVVMYVARTGMTLTKLAIAGSWLALAVVVAAVMWLGDRHASFRRPLPLEQAKTSPQTLGRPTLPTAMAEWLSGLCKSHAEQGCGAKETSSTKASPPISLPVYFVSTMGGGIRAAAWTAQVLLKLDTEDPTFMDRTFSISGVSGGAVGAAAYRACGSEDLAAKRSCLETFARTDLVSPLLSAWLFEDTLAKVIPTRWCGTSACGFLSRGAWFEASMESAIPGLRTGIWASRKAGTRFKPYLLLNSTWVETGERAIASDLQIRIKDFPGAKDQLAIADHDLPLGTSAHNAARFPYVNAIGQLAAPSKKCDLRNDGELHWTETSADPKDFGKQIGCGHLADGGYFDNSGGQSSIDALAGMVRCLTVSAALADAELDKPCVAMSPDARRWLRANLVPTIIFIRNGVDPDSETAKDCSRPEQPTQQVLGQQRVHSCTSLDASYRPEQPVCRRNFTFYVDALGPPITLFNGAGTGAHGQLSEAGQRRQVLEARAALAAAGIAAPAVAAVGALPSKPTVAPDSAAPAAPVPPPPVITLDQTPDGIRYPLGWHLSKAAVAGLTDQASDCSVH